MVSNETLKFWNLRPVTSYERTDGIIFQSVVNKNLFAVYPPSAPGLAPYSEIVSFLYVVSWVGLLLLIIELVFVGTALLYSSLDISFSSVFNTFPNKSFVYSVSLIIDKFKIENELKQLYLSKSRYDKSRIELESKYNRELPQQLKFQERYLNGLEQDINKVEDLSADNFKIIIRDQFFDSRKDASTKFYQTLSLLKTGEEIKIGEISGFDIVGTREELRFTPVVYIKGIGKYKVEINNIDEIGNILKLENMLKSFETKIETVKEQIEYTKKQLNDTKDELDKPFAYTERIRELQKEKARIDSELDLDKQEMTQELSDENSNDDELER